MCWWVITFFVIFAVLDVSLAVNLCINRGFLHLSALEKTHVVSLGRIALAAGHHILQSLIL